ncbi:cupin domain-containing protein [Actinomadura darangshiensis]|uniref:Cupin domain-containing protein n=1 Tax=Actinomadura darangshiensis TaxID=705336 RepID=A0A4R5AQH6_9ACTN|nr:cupin domain-containing protein [Actinomadura darangshiensis]TDD73916.1 cupin domain-containing protein [Actinomadura darangshiensis]
MHITRTPADTTIPPAQWMTGDVWIDEIGTLAQLKVDSVSFAPGSRTAWHRHPLGQILHVTAGAGLVQRRGGAIEDIRAGDTVRVEPGEWHWHGAGPTTSMTHLAVQVVAEDGTEADLGAPVTDDEYR